MFEESIAIIKNTFLEYKGTGMYVALFFISMLYILLKEEDKKNRAFFAYFPIFTLFITLNPIFNKLVGSIFTSSVYWRVYWVIPLGITIAYGAVKFINNENEKSKKIIATIGIIIVIMISGKFIYYKGNYFKLGNFYKLPDDDVYATHIIGADEAEYKKAIVPEGLVAHVRQIDATINLAFPRDPEGKSNPILNELNAGNVEGITKIAKENKCNYIVFKKATVLMGEMEEYGFEKLGETQNYAIYKLSKEE